MTNDNIRSEAGFIEINNDGELCVYYAWAEKPFVSSEGVPLTAQ